MGYKDFLAFKTERPSNSSTPVPPSPTTVGGMSRSMSPALQSPNPFASSNDPSASNSLRASRINSMDLSHQKTRSMALDLVKNQVMINYLYQQQTNNGWRSEKSCSFEGVMLRIARDNYLSHPPEMVDTSLAVALRDLNVQAAMTIHSPVIRTYLQSIPNCAELPLLNGLAVQVVPTIEALSRARTHQFAAVVADEALLTVWDDDAVNMLQRAKTIEWELMQLLWNSNPFDSKMASKMDLTINEKEVSDSDSEEMAAPKPRPTIFINTVLVSLSLMCIIGTLGLGLRQLVIELAIDMGYSPNPYTRLALLAFTPIWLFFGMFFFNVLITNVAELIGPIAQMNINSKHYSAVTSPRLTHDLPHVTIQCPVYKEGLADVIQPTVVSIKKAISTYELQGGSANIFVNDDGLQLISEEEREERLAFYADNNIGWVARPGHSKDPSGFQRKGKFKKASNMNFAMRLSCAMEDKLVELQRGLEWNSTDEAEATSWALEQAVNETGGVAWADGNIRIGDYILISEYRIHHTDEMTNALQLILILVYLSTVFLTLLANLRSRLRSPFCSSHLVS